MTKIMSNSKEPAVTYRHDYATEAHITGCWRFPDASTTSLMYEVIDFLRRDYSDSKIFIICRNFQC